MVGCGEGDEGPEMRPGEDCLSCHRSGGEGESSFSAAGTVFDASGAGVSGVTVTITDAGSTTRTTTSNAVGNFFFEQALAAPLTIKLSKAGTEVSMPIPAESGACNSCHSGDSRLHFP